MYTIKAKNYYPLKTINHSGVYMGNKFTKKLIILSLTLFLISLTTLSVQAATITVDDGGGKDFTGIQDAINHSIEDDTILVYSGTYFENVNVTTRLVLRGYDDGTGQPLVDGEDKGNTIEITAEGVTFERFNVVGSGPAFFNQEFMSFLTTI